MKNLLKLPKLPGLIPENTEPTPPIPSLGPEHHALIQHLLKTQAPNPPTEPAPETDPLAVKKHNFAKLMGALHRNG